MTNVDHDVLAARAVLGWLVEPGSQRLHRLVAKEGPIGALELLVAGRVPGTLGDAATTRLAGQEPAEVAADLMSGADRLGVRLVVPEDPEWPSGLADLEHISRGGDRIDRDVYPPHALWVRGPARLDRLASSAVAMVGSRSATDYGSHIAAEIAFGLAGRGWTVVSGGAYGIDAAAHRGALAADGPTVAVLACGVDRPYPPSNLSLFEHLTQTGLMVSEWPPGSDPHRHRFIIRNRVIAAMSQGLVLVEAGARSGARQSMRRARQLKRVVMAVPGPATSEQSIGCHEELRADGDPRVRLVISADQVLEEIGRIGIDLAPPVTGPSRPHDDLSATEQQLVDAAPLRGGMTSQELAAHARIGLIEALAHLPSLELRGHLRLREDGTYALGVRQHPNGKA